MAVDDDHSGTIQKSELKKLFESQDVLITQQQLESCFDQLRIYGSGSINFVEFESGALGQEFFLDKKRLQTLFKYFDIDGNGVIDHGEITECFKRFGRNLK